MVTYHLALARTENDTKVWSNLSLKMESIGEIPLAFPENLFPPWGCPRSQQPWFQVAKGASVGMMEMLDRKKGGESSFARLGTLVENTL